MFSLFTKNFAIDLGTANTLIICNNEIVVNEPSIVALNRDTKEVIAVGHEALMMHGKTPENIRTIRPLKDGVIADFTVAEQMLRAFIRQANKGRGFWLSTIRMMICVPSGITDVEKRAVRDSAEHVGAREVYLIQEPMAAAIGIGLNVREPKGHMVIDIGGGTTEIAVISLGGIVCQESIRIAGDELNMAIKEYIRKEFELDIGERTAERIKIHVGAAVKDLKNPPEPIEIQGKHVRKGIPATIKIGYQQVAEAIDKAVEEIEKAILKTLEAALPEVASDIYAEGIYLTGGGALLRGLDERISKKTELKVHIAEDPLKAVAKGTAIALENLHQYRYLFAGER